MAALDGVRGACRRQAASCIPVEAVPAIAAAYAAWNANPCLADRANKVVNEITRLVVGIRNGALPGVAAAPRRSPTS